MLKVQYTVGWKLKWNLWNIEYSLLALRSFGSLLNFSSFAESVQSWLCWLREGCWVAPSGLPGGWEKQESHGDYQWKEVPPTPRHFEVFHVDGFDEHGFGSE